ncbi:hypothetical protein CKN73_03645 [Carnobacterium divergens]|uniref:hypothetical protein n=1 Tax=Carnobacterium divergens TaxID=2748 RepID=UPI0010719F71|nr:hypothetical protein [Carnobacterium divergens]TFJ43746.1 hypothetical protein CKN77_03575 [Carnobacterium divergens]TFJ51576.1 hypothetical protein CKN73_03645 [Carnobacterium divergens]TFJ56566.1 hypothetical protein CKN83_03590 [Carnobacterium divergens]TFJ64206.1 hypothetical protein CKN89_03670 [Carnobacterium divergens]TFJ73209.1 hypothetical protein CKN91_03595 [Carnobacterium divergens]
MELAIPQYIADWLKKHLKSKSKFFGVQTRPPILGSLIERTIGFKTEGQLQFYNTKAYEWSKLYGIIEFCNELENDLVVLVDSLVERMTKGVELPSNLKTVLPSDATLTIEDLKLIDSL